MHEAVKRVLAAEEAEVARLLPQWQHELYGPPAVCFGPDGRLRGLCKADSPIGEFYPVILPAWQRP